MTVFFNKKISYGLGFLFIMLSGLVVWWLSGHNVIVHENFIVHEMNQKNLYVIDSGHGYKKGNDCLYNSVKSGDTCFYEYKFNFEVSKLIASMLSEKGIKYVWVDSLPLEREIPVMQRVAYVNYLAERLKEIDKNASVCLFSIHANGSSNKYATGIEVFSNIDKCEEYSDSETCKRHMIKAGEILSENLKSFFPESDFREGKEHSFKKSNRAAAGDIAILKRTMAYAYLIECGFFVNEKERALMSTPQYKKKMAFAIYSTICQIEGLNPSEKNSN